MLRESESLMEDKIKLVNLGEIGCGRMPYKGKPKE
jgi:hypothetical protein